MNRRSLRARLLVATVSLVALGLIVAGTATYGALRSSLLGRVDTQLQTSATQAGVRELFARPDRGPLARVRGAASGVTYAGRLDASGRVTAERVFGFLTSEAPPALPRGTVIVAQRGVAPFFTTGAQGGSDVTYRVLALAMNDGGAIVLAIPLDDVSATLARLLVVEIIVSLVVLLAVAWVALWLVRVGLQPLETMGQTAAQIAAGDLTRRVEHADPGTEVGRLGVALNRMLERIEGAFAQKEGSEARLRRFVADASHELRTPLTSIRGYAELFRRGADERPEDLANAMRRIEEESTRMSGLVEELLLLARLDQGRALEAEPIDLAEIVTDAVNDARAVQPERTIDLALDGVSTVTGDAARMRQVFANLLANALVHTPVDAPIHVSSRTREGAVEIEIADEGPGMSSADVARAFDRFFRADPARARESGGAGLGLSIASAIVHAHGGSIDLASEPEDGTRVTVRLPRRA